MVDLPQANTPYRAKFRRYECKYLIRENTVDELVRYIAPYVEPDPYAKDWPGYVYPVSSIYLDNSVLKLYRETREGIRDRIKLRIRSYQPSNPKPPVFLEIKRRRNNLVLKSRARIDWEQASDMLSGFAPDISQLHHTELACYEEFVSLMSRWGARPIVSVRYEREAYVGRFDRDHRVTIDRQIQCAPAGDVDLGFRAGIPERDWRPIERRFLVLELKFNNAFPLWMRDLIRYFDLRRTSYSKYGHAIQRAVDLSRGHLV